jgi:glyoxylase-like metal-dependent hydrolase (beta-lactamase superfamily II)
MKLPIMANPPLSWWPMAKHYYSTRLSRHNELAKHIDVNSLKPDYILVSHGHGDHVADLVTVQKSSGAKVICIAEIAGWLGKQGIR